MGAGLCFTVVDSAAQCCSGYVPGEVDTCSEDCTTTTVIGPAPSYTCGEWNGTGT